MCLVQHDQGVDAEQAGMHRTRAGRHVVAAKQQTGADHVDRAHDDSRNTRLFKPASIIRMLAAQRGHRQRLVQGEMQAVADGSYRRLVARATAENGRETIGFGGCLIDNGASIHDIDQPPRKGAADASAASHSAMTLVLPRPVGMSTASGRWPVARESERSRSCQE